MTAELVLEIGMRDGRAVEGDASSFTEIEEPILVRRGKAEDIEGPCAMVIVSARLKDGVVGRDSLLGGASAQPKTAINAASCDGSGTLLLSPSVAVDRRSVVIVAVSPSTSMGSGVSTGSRTEANADMRFWT